MVPNWRTCRRAPTHAGLFAQCHNTSVSAATDVSVPDAEQKHWYFLGYCIYFTANDIPKQHSFCKTQKESARRKKMLFGREGKKRKKTKNTPENWANSRKAKSRWNTLQGRQGHVLDKNLQMPSVSSWLSVCLQRDMLCCQEAFIKLDGGRKQCRGNKQNTKAHGSPLRPGGDRLSGKVSICLQHQRT